MARLLACLRNGHVRTSTILHGPEDVFSLPFEVIDSMLSRHTGKVHDSRIFAALLSCAALGTACAVDLPGDSLGQESGTGNGDNSGDGDGDNSGDGDGDQPGDGDGDQPGDGDGDQPGDGDGDQPGDGDGDQPGDGDGDQPGDGDGDQPGIPCGPLELDWELDSDAERFESFHFVDDGVYAVDSSFAFDPRSRISRFDTAGQLLSQVPWNSFPGEGEQVFSHLISTPDGGLAALGMPQFDQPTLEVFDSENNSLWIWAPPAQPGQIPAHLARASTGELIAMGENYFEDNLWLNVFDAEGNLLEEIGTLNAGDEVFMMHAGGLAIDAQDRLVIGGWTVHPGSNDVWVAKVDLAGAIVWKSEPSGQDGVLADVMVADDGSIYAAVEGDGLYAFSPEGVEQWRVPIQPWIPGAALLGGTDPIVIVQDELRRYDGDGELIETIPFVANNFAIDVAASEDCRVIVGGGFPAWAVQLRG